MPETDTNPIVVEIPLTRRHDLALSWLSEVEGISRKKQLHDALDLYLEAALAESVPSLAGQPVGEWLTAGRMAAKPEDNS